MKSVSKVLVKIKPVANSKERDLPRDLIILECQKLNGKHFNGTVNFSEAKVKKAKVQSSVNTIRLITHILLGHTYFIRLGLTLC